MEEGLHEGMVHAQDPIEGADDRALGPTEARVRKQIHLVNVLQQAEVILQRRRLELPADHPVNGAVDEELKGLGLPRWITLAEVQEKIAISYRCVKAELRALVPMLLLDRLNRWSRADVRQCADDIANEIFLRLIDKWDAPGPILTYKFLYWVSLETLDKLIYGHRLDRSGNARLAQVSIQGADLELIKDSADVELEILRRVPGPALSLLRQHMPKDDLELLISHHSETVTISELQERTGMNACKLKSKLLRARQRARQILDGFKDDRIQWPLISGGQ